MTRITEANARASNGVVAAARPQPRTGFFVVVSLAAAIIGCSIYANLVFLVTDPAQYRFFPPFTPHYNANHNRHLGAEYFNMARALAEGEGFAHPFDAPTGATAWQPPVLPLILAGFYWLVPSTEGVMAIVICLQVAILIGTGWLVLALARRTAPGIGPVVAGAIYLAALLCNFQLWFQWTHDNWLVLLALDLLVAGLVWLEPLASSRRAAAWGLFGGVSALINPAVGMAWGVLSLAIGLKRRAGAPLAVAVLGAAVALAPWAIRNYLLFGRLIPVKSNLPFELYQTHCLQNDGLLQGDTFRYHPYHKATRERKLYEELGETAYLDRKREQFFETLRKDPLDYADRVARRFLGATVWYVPFWSSEHQRPWVLWLSRVTHPLPFLALVVLVFTGIVHGLHPAHWAVIGIYLAYLAPYVALSYYERYGLPLLGVKALLIIWAAERVLARSAARRDVSPAS